MTLEIRGVQSGKLFVGESGDQYETQPVICLGTTFTSEDARREHYLERLKEKLPELRMRPDFPHGEDEDILRMSDPPF